MRRTRYHSCSTDKRIHVGVRLLEADKAEGDPDPNSRVFAQQRKTNIKTYSSLYKLDPFVDEEGILRVGGRVRRASLSDDVKFLIILPRNSHVTTFIVRYFHERTSHQGKTMTLNEVRSNGFWIINGTVAVSSIVSSCVKCKKLRGAVQEQRMSDLPEDRLRLPLPLPTAPSTILVPLSLKMAGRS